MDSIVNVPERNTFETRISLVDLNTKSASYDSALNYSYGVLTLFSKTFACIKPAFYNYGYDQKIEYAHSETVIFDPSTALIGGVDGKVNAQKNVYLVRYVAGGTTVNAKTGETQPTIDYSAPVEILLTHSKKQCIFLAVEDGFVVMKITAHSENAETSESASLAIRDLDEKALTDLRAIIENDIKKQGFAYSSEFPRYLYGILGTKDIQRFATSVSEFVKQYLADSFRYVSSYAYNGKKIPGVIMRAEKEEAVSLPNGIITERISCVSLLSDVKTDMPETNSRIGVVSFCNNRTGFINPGFGEAVTGNNALSVIFNPSVVKTIPENNAFDTKNNIYLVLFSVSGTVINTKTGLEHPAIDYSSPLVILRSIPRKECDSITVSTSEVIICRVGYEGNSNSVENKTFERCLTEIDVRLSAELATQKYLLASSFPLIAKQCGLANFRDYADSVALFLEKYLTKYTLFKNVAIEGKIYPGVIVEKDNNPFGDTIQSPQRISEDVCDSTRSSTSFETFNRLFEAGLYAEALSSGDFRDCQPQTLPVEQLEKALTAANRLLFPDNEEKITLNSFQKEVFYCSTTIEFIRKWKHDGVFTDYILEQCCETSVAGFDYPDDRVLAAKLLNALGYQNSLNNNYVGITGRFVACENVLFPHFFILRAFVRNSATSIQKIVSEYCQIVKDLKHSTSGPKMTDDLRIGSFVEVLNAINSHLVKIETLPRNIRTNIVSVFFEYGKLEKATRVISIWDPNHESLEWRTIELYYDYADLNEQFVIRLLSEGVNIQLLQRCIALIWGNFSKDSILPTGFLKLLSWIVIHEQHTSIDEILRYPSSKSLTRIDKQNMLINSFALVCDLSIEDRRMYALASFIALVIQPDIDSETISVAAKEKLVDWSNYSDTFYKREIERIGTITPETEELYVLLFPIFQLDIPHYTILQKEYATWFLASSGSITESQQDTKSTLDSLYQKCAYGAYVEVYSDCLLLTIGDDSEKYATQNVISLVRLHRYADAVAFLSNTTEMTIANKNAFISRVLGENFKENGISPSAFSCFDENFSCRDAINLLKSELKPNQSTSINSLIAMYIHEEEYVKAAYLFVIFSSKADKGYARLYSQFRSSLGRLLDFNRLKSHHHVIELAFQVLTAERLVAFLNWASSIKIPEFKERKETHVFHYYYDALISDASSKDSWSSFLNHLLKNGLDKNAWNICVCETVLRCVFQSGNTSFSEGAIDSLLRSADISALTPALLVYSFRYIEDKKSIVVCQKLIDTLSNKETHEYLIENNNWLRTYKQEIDAFKHYCLNASDETGSNIYHDVLAVLGINLTVSELETITKASTGKRSLFTTICQNYLENNDIDGTINVLFSNDWNNLSDIEKEVLRILRIIFEDDDLLLTDEADLFEDEIAVRRFKRDCAEILMYYPEKTGLFSFESACTNESYKMLVYSYVFNVFYDQDLYETLDKQYSDFKNNRDFRIYLRLLTTAYKSQSIRNTTFPAFYKKWRYLKLYLSYFILNPNGVDNNGIISLMKENGHYEDFYVTSFVPFVQIVKEFWQLNDLTSDFKTHFLFAIMVSHAEDLFLAHAQTLSMLSDKEKSVCRQLVESLDYRYFNTSLFKFFWEDLKLNHCSTCLAVSSAVSSYAFDSILAFSTMHSDFAIDIFSKLAFGGKPAQTLSEVISSDVNLLKSYQSMIVPLLCSRQFVFYIYDRFRALVIKQRNSMLCEKFSYISDYLTRSGDKYADTISVYLWTLYYCMRNDKENARKSLANTDIATMVPEQWKKEAQRIIEFVNGESKKFKPDRLIVDGSQENRTNTVDIRFALRILHKIFGEDYIPSSEEEASAVYDSYLSSEETWDRTRNGLIVLVWLSKHRAIANSSFPTLNDLAIDVGLQIIKLESGFSMHERFLVAASLYKNRSIYLQQEYSLRYENLKQGFLNLVNNNPSISIWVKYSAIIEELLKEAQLLLDFSDLRARILDKCSDLMSLDLAYVDKENGYSTLLSSFAGLTSVYSLSVRKAIQEELKNLGDGIRLDIKIENRQISDEQIYFQIRNSGNRAVSFSNDCISVVLQQDNQPDVEISIDNIRELHCSSMTGGHARVVLSSTDQEVFVKICVYRNNNEGNKELVCSDGGIFTVVPSENMSVPVDAKYNVTSAISEEAMLFGRDHQKELLTRSIPQGVTLIYGSSRIGKTSLMNWVRNKLAFDLGNVITIICGGENGLGKESDYVRNINDRNIPIPYDDDYGMSQYLLIDTIVFGLTQRDRLCKPSSKQVPQDLIRNILRILKDDSTNIKSKYYEINDLLDSAGIELWLMLDEFQQVVEKWNPDKWSDFVEVCNLLSSTERNKPNCIKLIICGSDDLLKHMTLKRDSVWKSAFRTTVSVGALEEKSFTAMIEQDPAIKDTNITFSEMALHTLFIYTGGVALYGKEICNAILEDVRTNPKKRLSRTCLYTADISDATQRLLNKQNDELSTRAREGISEIYAAVTKNLDEYTDMQMLWYMAKWLYENKKNDGFPESIFTGVPLTANFGENLNDSLRIAEARGILRQDVSKQNNETVYSFTTLFYFYAFYGSAKGNLNEKLIFADEDSSAEMEDYTSDPLVVLRDSFKLVPREERKQALHMLYGALSPEEEKEFRGAYGDYSETNIGTQNNVQVNVQSMTNAFATLLSGDASSDKYLSAFSELPSIQMFIPQENKKLLGDRITALREVSDEKALREAEYKIEELTSPAEQEMTGTYIAAAMNSTDFFRVSDEQWKELIHVSKKELESQLPPEFITSLGFAVMLHNVFEAIRLKASEDDVAREKAYAELDYCPVAIMYCKVVEALLKELHTPIYAQQIGDRTLNSSSGVVFGDLLHSDGTVDTSSKDLTIGSFSYHIVKPSNFDESNNIDNPDDFLYEPKMWMIQKITRVKSYAQAINLEWSQHAVDLAVIQGVRNKSAHEARPITKENFDWLIQTLFDDGELIRIAELANRKYPNK